MRVPFGPFEPDKSLFNGSASGNIVNAVPVAGGWGPLKGLDAISASLGALCMGAIWVVTSTGTTRIIAATASQIFELNNTDYTWIDITGSSGPYSATERWTFTRFGDMLLIHQMNNPIQKYDINVGGSVSDLGGNPPQAKYSWVAGDFVVLGNLSDVAGERKVRWCGYNDAESWTIGIKGADYQELPEGGEVFAGFGDRGGFYVIQRQGMQYFPFSLDSGFTFTRTVINPTQGTVAPRSVVSIGGGRFFFLSEDGFFADAERKPIGAERVDRWFYQQVDPGSISDVQGAVDPYDKMVWWSYQASNGTKYRLGYDWQLDRWCRSDLPIGDLIPLVTIGVTWDGLDELYANIDLATVTFDSSSLLGGRPTLATFNSNNELCFFRGGNLLATFETSFVQPDDLARSFVNGARVTTDARNFTVTDTVIGYHGDTPVTSATAVPNRAGLVPFRSDGRLHKQTLAITAGESWTIVSDIDVSAVPSGQQ